MGVGVIVHTKNFSQSVYTEFYNQYYHNFYKPVIAGHSSGRASLLWYSNENYIYKTTYTGSSWSTPVSFGTNNYYPTVSITNPPGDTAYAFWTWGTSAPYSIVTSSNGGPLQKGSSPWSYIRRVSIVGLDAKNSTTVELTPPVLVTPDGNQIDLSFIDVNDTMSYTADNVWTAFQTQPVSLPPGVSQGAIIAGRSIIAQTNGSVQAFPIAFDVIDASSGSIQSEQVIQPTSSSTPTSTTDQLLLTFQVKSGRQVKLLVQSKAVLGNGYTAAIGHCYSENDTSAIQKMRAANLSFIQKPKEFGLQPNFPNPFNPSTTLQYQLKDGGHVRLVVYNTLGQEVKTLIDESQQAGYKTHNFNAASLSSGVYYVRLLVTDEFDKPLFLATQKLLLMK